MQNLDRNVKIVNEDGSPTEFFMQLLQERGIGQQDNADAIKTLSANRIIGNNGVVVTGTGKLIDGNVPLSADVQAILNQLVAAHGDIIFKGASGWELLTAGSSGQFLKTLGAGNDPVWAAAGGGGGSWWFSPPSASSFSLLSGDGNQMVLTDDADVGMIMDPGVAASGHCFRMAYRTLSNPSGDWVMTAKIPFAFLGSNYTGGQLGIVNSSTNQAVDYGFRSDGNLEHCAWNSLTNRVVNAFLFGGPKYFDWFRIEKVGGNLNYYYSDTGKNWIRAHTEPVSNYFSSAPDRVGPMIWLFTAGNTQITQTCQYFTLTGSAV